MEGRGPLEKMNNVSSVGLAIDTFVYLSLSVLISIFLTFLPSSAPLWRLISMQRLLYDLLKVICQIAANWLGCDRAQCEYILTCVFPALRWAPKDLWQPKASLNTNTVSTNTVGKDMQTHSHTHWLDALRPCQQNDTADAISIFVWYSTWQSQQVALSLLIIHKLCQLEL